MTEPTPHQLHQFILDSFSEDELDLFCLEYFSEARDSFGSGMSKYRKALELVTYCQRRAEMNRLLVALEKVREMAFRQKFTAQTDPTHPSLTVYHPNLQTLQPEKTAQLDEPDPELQPANRRREWLRQIPVWGRVVAVVVLSSLLLRSAWALLPDSDDKNESNVTTTSTSTPTATPTPSIGSTRIRPTDEAVMVFVPAGEFVMGSEDGEDDEKPFHVVYLDSYWIDQTEVTNDMYTLCVRDGACERPSDLTSFTRDNYYPNPAFADFPVIFVNWGDAQNYCEWAGARLPTEAEWEKAARWDEAAQEARTYPWGEAIDCDHANYRSGVYCVGDTTAVGSNPEGISPYGALDMAGNVWEWTADWYAADFYSELFYDNPAGPVTGRTKVVRGGSWNLNESIVRAAYRNHYSSILHSQYVGFRCVQE